LVSEVSVEKTTGESSYDIVTPSHKEHKAKWEVYKVEEKYKEQLKQTYAQAFMPAILRVRICLNCWRR
jgi:quinol monooxygenase YgiN